MSQDNWKNKWHIDDSDLRPSERLIQTCTELGKSYAAAVRDAQCLLLGLPTTATDQECVNAIFDLWAAGEKLVVMTRAGVSGCVVRIAKLEIVDGVP